MPLLNTCSIGTWLCSVVSFLTEAVKLSMRHTWVRRCSYRAASALWEQRSGGHILMFHADLHGFVPAKLTPCASLKDVQHKSV